jgi:hypothetical protein
MAGADGTQTTEQLLGDGDTVRVTSPRASKPCTARVLEGTERRELEGLLPNLRIVSHVFEICAGCGFDAPITVDIPQWAVSAIRYERLYVYCTRSAGKKPELLYTHTAKENQWKHDGHLTVKLFHSVAQLFVCCARHVHEAEIVNEHGGIVRSDSGVSVEVAPKALPDEVREFKIGIEALGDMRKRPRFVVSPVISPQGFNFKAPVIITLPHSLENANRWNCHLLMQRHDNSHLKIAPFRVDYATARFKIDDLSNVKMCWMEIAPHP